MHAVNENLKLSGRSTFCLLFENVLGILSSGPLCIFLQGSESIPLLAVGSAGYLIITAGFQSVCLRLSVWQGRVSTSQTTPLGGW